MQLEWVNHASVVVGDRGVRLISDPWLDGTAFDDGWGLLSETAFPYERFETITHLWFSHEHPDHFSPANIRAIPPEIRARIVVLFQKTFDRKIVSFCRAQGFADVIELRRRRWHELAPGFEVLCEPFPFGDSALLIRTPDTAIVNLNDCTIVNPRHAAELLKELGRPIDVLLSQFSYANWSGNPDEPEKRLQSAADKLECFRLHCEWLQPKVAIPFASYVWFCHRENTYMNLEMNGIADVRRFISERTSSRPLVLYPGDLWEVGANHDDAAAVARYEADSAGVPSRPLVSSQAVATSDLISAADQFLDRMLGRPGSLARRARARLHRLGPTAIWLADRAEALAFCWETGLQESATSEANCDVSCSSGALAYAFRNLWGGDSMAINGRFSIPAGGMYQHWRAYTILASKINVYGSFANYVRVRSADVLRHPLWSARRLTQKAIGPDELIP